MTLSSTGASRPPLVGADFSRQPFVLAWELTRACNLACVHCRAAAQVSRNPDELSTEEGFRLIDDIAAFDIPPALIFTGGDPLRRPDLDQLIEHATSRRIRCTLSPAATPLASHRRLRAARNAGVQRLAVSLDGSLPARHDAFRRVPRSFDWTMGILRHANDLDLPVQIHTTLSRQTIDDLPAIADLLDKLKPVMWAVFCLVPTGRGKACEEIDAREYESIFEWLLERRRGASWDLKLTEGYHFRRVQAQRERGPVLGSGFAAPEGISRAPKAVNAGNGFCFVSHTGEVCPSGFLPVVAGNIRDRSIVDLYRNASIFLELRDPSLLRGKCGRCPFRDLCGGSRSRAFAHTGDYLESDPACLFEPPHHRPPGELSIN